MEFLNNIIAIATTEGDGTVLLINKSQINNQTAKCVAYETETRVASLIDNIAKATTFNAFTQILDETLASSFIDRVNRTQTDDRIKEINSFLSQEEDMSLEKAQELVSNYFEKGGKPAFVGEKRMFGGREYIKTTDGWKFHGKGNGAKAKEHAQKAIAKIKEVKKKEPDKVKEVKQLTAEDMLKHPTTTKMLIDTDNEDMWKDLFLAKTANYKPNTYYRIEGTELDYAGVGTGMYVGRDRQALKEFYDIENKGLEVREFKGEPKWLDLMDYDKYNAFETEAKNKYGDHDRAALDHIKKLAMAKGYEGIRYYDPSATGEEFVLFDTSKLKEIKSKGEKVVYDSSGNIHEEGDKSKVGETQTILDPNGNEITGKVESMDIDKIKPSEFHALQAEENDTAEGYARGLYSTFDSTDMASAKETLHRGKKLTNADQLPPIPVSKDGYIIDGNNRYCAAKFHTKLKTLNVIKIDKTYKEYFGDEPLTANYDVVSDKMGTYFEEKQ